MHFCRLTSFLYVLCVCPYALEPPKLELRYSRKNDLLPRISYCRYFDDLSTIIFELASLELVADF